MIFLGYGVTQVATKSAEGKWPMELEVATALADRLNTAAGKPQAYGVVPLHGGEVFFSTLGLLQDPRHARKAAEMEADDLL